MGLYSADEALQIMDSVNVVYPLSRHQDKVFFKM